MAKRKRLGSPPEKHRLLASGYAHGARIAAQNIRKALAKGDCREAASEIPYLIRDASAAARERAGAGVPATKKGRSQMFNAQRSVFNKFVAKCVKK